MIEYILAHSPDHRILNKANNILINHGIIVIPTDTNWVFAVSSFSKVGIEKLYKVKKEHKQKHFSLICDSISMASELAIIDNVAFKYLKKNSPGHFTFIFEATKKIAKYVQASKTDKQIGIRLIPQLFINELINLHGHALVTTNIPYTSYGLDDDEPIYSYQLEEKLGSLIEMILDPGEIDFVGPSTIIDFSQGTGPMLVREGAGQITN